MHLGPDNLELFGLGPQPLKIVKLPLLVVKNMDHHIVKIEQHPETFPQPFGA